MKKTGSQFRKKTMMATLMLLSISLLSFAQESATVDVAVQAAEQYDTPHGVPVVKIFSNFHTDFVENGTDDSGFEIQRAYFGYKYKMSNEWSAKVLLDITSGGATAYTAFLKNAALTYKRDALTVDFGMIGMKQWKTQEKGWGHRYVYKSLQDQYKFGTSADLGVSASYEINDMFSADITFSNGEGYKKVEADNIFKSAFGLTIKPKDGLVLRGYVDHMEDAVVSQVAKALYAGYSAETFNVALEYNMQSNHEFNEAEDFKGLSVYAAYEINDVFEVFVRYDEFTSDIIVGDDEDVVIIGLQYAPIKNVSIAANYRSVASKTGAGNTASGAYLNFMYRF